jgi:hypothetical protein
MNFGVRCDSEESAIWLMRATIRAPGRGTGPPSREKREEE